MPIKGGGWLQGHSTGRHRPFRGAAWATQGPARRRHETAMWAPVVPLYQGIYSRQSGSKASDVTVNQMSKRLPQGLVDAGVPVCRLIDPGLVFFPVTVALTQDTGDDVDGLAVINRLQSLF